MSKKQMKARVSEKGGVVTVKAIVSHPMDTGRAKDSKTGKLIPAHYIEELVCKHNGQVVMTAQLSGGVSKNPYIAFKFSGAAKGEEVELSWVDNKGESDQQTFAIK